MFGFVCNGAMIEDIKEGKTHFGPSKVIMINETIISTILLEKEYIKLIFAYYNCLWK